MGSKANYRKDVLRLSATRLQDELEQDLTLATATYDLAIALGWNLSQNQLDDFQNPNSEFVEVSDLKPNVGVEHATGSDKSPQRPAEVNPGEPILVNPDNAERMRKHLLPMLTIMDSRDLFRLGYQI